MRRKHHHIPRHQLVPYILTCSPSRRINLIIPSSYAIVSLLRPETCSEHRYSPTRQTRLSIFFDKARAAPTLSRPDTSLSSYPIPTMTRKVFVACSKPMSPHRYRSIICGRLVYLPRSSGQRESAPKKRGLPRNHPGRRTLSSCIAKINRYVLSPLKSKQLTLCRRLYRRRRLG
jgi:hypothetical protein